MVSASIEGVNSRTLKSMHACSRLIAKLSSQAPRHRDSDCCAGVSRTGDLGAAIGFADAGGGNGGAGRGVGANH